MLAIMISASFDIGKCAHSSAMGNWTLEIQLFVDLYGWSQLLYVNNVNINTLISNSDNTNDDDPDNNGVHSISG
jgi:hypothetical protein